MAAATSALGECEARFNALVRACTTRCDRLIDALERLPESATFDPLAAEPLEVSQKAPTKRKASAPGSRKPITPLPVKGIGASKLGQAGEALLKVAAQSAQNAGQSVSPAKGRLGEQAAAKRDDGKSLGALAGQTLETGGKLLAALLENYPAPKGRSGKAQPINAQTTQAKPTTLAGAGQALIKAARTNSSFPQGLGRAFKNAMGPAQTLPDKSMLRKLSADALKSGAAAIGKAPTVQSLLQDLIGATGKQTLGGLTQGAPLIGKLLAELAAQPAQKSRRTANQTPAAAPRARSRLLQAANQDVRPDEKTSRARREQAAAPESDRTENGETGTELAGNLNRLLLDQAWLRGVDLT